MRVAPPKCRYNLGKRLLSNFLSQTFMPVKTPWQALREWILDNDAPAQADWVD